jgi:arginase
MDTRIIVAPYNLGRLRTGPGNGPERLLKEGAADALTRAGHAVTAVDELLIEEVGHETGNIFAVNRLIADEVRATRAIGVTPVVLAGNCNSAIGVMAGLAGDGASGLVWFDAHGDANTPETTRTGYFDGLPLGVVVGWCWQGLAATVPGHQEIEPSRVVHVGGRSFDGDERTAMVEAGMSLIAPDELGDHAGRARLLQSLDDLGQRTSQVHLHIDLDVIDGSDGIASRYAEPDGPSVEDLELAVVSVGDRCSVGSITLCSYDPAFDHDGRAAAVGVRLIEAMGRALS